MTTTTRTSTLLTPYLCVSDARRAMDWYRAVFAAQVRGEPYVMDDGRIGHAQLDLGGAALMLADEFPEVDVEAPPSSGPRSVTLNLQLGDVDAVLRRARENGAPKVWDAEDKPYGRSGRFDDPFGHRWQVLTPPAEVPAQAEAASPAGTGAVEQGAGEQGAAEQGAAEQGAVRHGDVEYLTISTADTAAARRFYGELLGWRFEPGSVPDGWQIHGVRPMAGMHGGGSGEIALCFHVDDIDAAVERVRRLGGTAEEPQQRPYGRLATCTDDQGRTFHLNG